MNWKKYIVPTILTTVILSLFGFSTNLVCKNIDKNEKQIEQVKKEKVDNKTLQLMIESLKVQQQNTNKNLDRLYQEVKDIKKDK